MIYRSSKNFNKQFAKLKPAEQKRCLQRIALFKTDARHALLRVHPLTAQYAGHQSLNAGGDLRIIFLESQNYIEFVAVGTHSQLYD